MKPFVWLIILLSISVFGFGQTGTLQGKVFDATTNEPLIGATISIEELSLGTVSDEEGKYLLKDIPQKTYVIKASYVGYKIYYQFEVRIESGINQLDFALEPQTKEQETVEIVASPFQKTEENLVSIKTVGIEQIRSNPGGNNDISRVLQSLPGVSGSFGFRNDLIIRGGAPNENVYYLDGIEVPNINHFSTQGAAGGPVGILNANFISKVNFQSSAFNAKYDNALSSVLDFEMISGNSERFQTFITVGASEAGITFDTPIGKKLSLLTSVRRSYLQFLFKAIDLPFLPDYWDFQTKLEWKLNPSTTISYINIGSIDRFQLNSPANTSPERLYLLDRLPIFNQNTLTNGVVLKKIQKNGFFTIALSRNSLWNRIYKYEDNDPIKGYLQDYVSTENENKLRLNVVNRSGSWRITYGGVIQFVQYTNTSFLKLAIGQTVDYQTTLNFFRYGVYGSISRKFLNDKLTANFGIRTDLNSFTTTGNNPLETISPRLGINYQILPKWAINASVGRYAKLPPYTILGFQNNGNYSNQNVKYILCDHYVAGFEFLPSTSWIVTIEGFYKWYQNYPVSVKDGISLANLGGNYDVLGNEDVSSTGKGRTYGLEVFTQKKLTKQLYGLIAYTLYWSQFSGETGKFIRSAWDNRHLISLTGGYQFGKKRNWEIAAKWRFLGNSPYTPYDIQRSIDNYFINGNGYPDYSRFNEEEIGSFSQIDFRLDKKWYFKKWNLNLFLDVQNLLGTKNPGIPAFALRRTPDNSGFVSPPEAVLIQTEQSSRIPTIGARIKF
ncbi:MAG: TonB-dependent receptor [Bacteroidia bacterium]|nr:TonB-dependent receptor [Bacteroidia bacterium]